MKKNIKLLALAVPLALSLNANAATFAIGTATAGSTYTNSFTNGSGALASFFDAAGGHWIDHIEFNLATGADVAISATSTATSFFINDGPSAYNLVAASTGTPPSFVGFLNAGNYQVDIKSSNGVFDATLSVAAAVPEPETYALMLAGLALVGYTARRRQA